jgi:hypothetical protein
MELKNFKVDLPKIEECRPEVQKFARIMEYKLRLNDYKGGWKDCDSFFLFDKLNEEVEELERELFVDDSIDDPPYDPVNVSLEAADVGNVAMMLIDLYGEFDFE